jgi:hypothetical protein
MLAPLLACKKVDPDRPRRNAWIEKQTAEQKVFVRDVLTRGNGLYEFYDGWYGTENDPKGGAWRWMDKRGIVRLRTTFGDSKTPRDMTLKIFGWVPWEHVGLRVIQIEFAVNGHVLARFDPPKASFEYPLFVPRHLLANGDWVDFSITVTNTARPTGDWRDLGFATTGFHWIPVEGG